ncbi:acyl-CoA dehydrogenase family protein [Flavobacterium sp. W21_SRS_FM6]|uniref:acyl-CoA dehydrogenase family protein n=1 Tax=Flavobacterium sp. W21_SRS_FM6 TaxID=3240268 RepID=UPI003F8F1BEC
MWQYKAPVEDTLFVINTWLDATTSWQGAELWQDLDKALIEQIIIEAGRFVEGELAPINASGDNQGCRLENGRVLTPDGFPAAYQAFIDGGWPALACDEHYGGQGLPLLLNTALMEMMAGANHAWFMYPGITHGAYECLHAHGSETIKKRYLPKIVSGEWLVSMDITEPQAGSDVGLIKSKAVEQTDGSYLVTGNKIFISGADHDLTENTLHLVLARTPDSLPGTRGLSLFLVSKFVLNEDGTLGDKNNLDITGIEHKLGIKGSATCSVSFDGAKAYLVGELNRGLSHMFIMMNAARLQVGLHGIGHMESATQQAIDYANERLQSRHAFAADKDPKAVAIKHHPAIKHKLNELKAFSEGSRIVAFWIAHLIDEQTIATQGAEKERIGQLLAVLTPIIKAFATEHGFRLASSALQVFGGYGYVNEYPIGQTLRDSRIAMIYEGTNEIQANDLVLRKIIADQGQGITVLLKIIEQELALHDDSRAEKELMTLLHGEIKVMVNSLLTRAKLDDIEYAANVAPDVMQVMGYGLLAYAWLKTLRVIEASQLRDVYLHKKRTGEYFFHHVLPLVYGYLLKIQAGDRAIPDIE